MERNYNSHKRQANWAPTSGHPIRSFQHLLLHTRLGVRARPGRTRPGASGWGEVTAVVFYSREVRCESHSLAPSDLCGVISRPPPSELN